MDQTQHDFTPPALIAATLIQKVEIDTLLSLCEAISAQQGVDKVGGLSIREWVRQQKAVRIEELQQEYNASIPAVAARLESVLEECHKPIGEDGNGH